MLNKKCAIPQLFYDPLILGTIIIAYIMSLSLHTFNMIYLVGDA